jgi:cyclophilin family peptidyl-prolyl cis-trans isomerase
MSLQAPFYCIDLCSLRKAESSMRPICCLCLALVFQVPIHHFVTTPAWAQGASAPAPGASENAQPQAVPAQPGPAAPAAEARPFDQVDAQWRQFDDRLKAIEVAYQKADSTQRRTLLEEYRGIVAEQRKLLPELRASAIVAYRAAPNASENVTNALLGLMANDLRDDEYESAMELGSLLRMHECKNTALPALIGEAAYCLDDFATAASELALGKQNQTLNAQAESYLEDVAQAVELWKVEQQFRKAEAQADDLPRVRLQTNQGDMIVELYENEAPQATANFIHLVEKGFYNGLSFHRVLPGFMAQGGCPNGTGSGGPGYTIYCECQQPDHRKHFRGTLSMAHAGRDTGGSQFFLTFRRTSHLDGRHTVFGRVIEGLNVLAEIQRRDPTRPGQPEPDRIVKAEVIRKRDHAYEPKKVGSR